MATTKWLCNAVYWVQSDLVAVFLQLRQVAYSNDTGLWLCPQVAGSARLGYIAGPLEVG